jgi:pyruvate kinase
MTAPGKSRSYPTTTEAQARSSIRKVAAHGTAKEKRNVFAAVRAKHPDLAKRSTIVPTTEGPGRRRGQPKGKRAGKR